MLLFFPKVYDDELVYSLVSRYHAYSGNITTRATNEELYGVRSYRCSAIIPADLKKLSTVTEPFGISFDDLLYGSTLYPYYGLFAQEDTRKRQYEQMRTGEQRYWASFLGIPRYSHYPRYLRYCPVCREREIQRLVGSMEQLICQAEARRAFLTLERQHIQYHQVADFEEKRERYRARWTAATERAEKKTITSIQEQDIVNAPNPILPPETFQRRNNVIEIAIDAMIPHFAHLDGKGDAVQQSDGLLILAILLIGVGS